MPPKSKHQEVLKPGVGSKDPHQKEVKKVETPKAEAKALPEERKDSEAGADALAPEKNENSRAGADALAPEENENSKAGAESLVPEKREIEKLPKAGADALTPEERKNSEAGADALAPGKCEVEKPKAGADALKPEGQAKEVEVKGNENQLQLQQMMSEMIALREQMNFMSMEKEKEKAEKAELMTIINQMKDATAQAKTEADAKVKASENQNHVIDFDDPSDEGESEKKDQDDPENDEDEYDDQCTPVPSDEEDEVIEDVDETEAERAKRLEQLKKMKTVAKDAKIAKKIVIEARLHKIEADLQALNELAEVLDSKVTDSEIELSGLRESIADLEVKQRELNSRLKEKYDAMKRVHTRELNALQEDHEKRRMAFNLTLLQELEGVKEKQKVQTSTLDEDYNKKRAAQNEIQKAVEDLKDKERECVGIKAEREGHHERSQKLRMKHAEVKKQYESLSLRCQRERKQKQEQEEKAGSWTQAVGRKPVKIEKVSEVRRIPKYTLPHIAPKERYQPSDRMPCPSWITRVARNTIPCSLGKNCPQLLRGCNQYHKDGEMVMAFVRGVRPVGWTETFEKNIRYEIDYWNGRNHNFNGLIPKLQDLSAWRKKQDTDDEKRNELRRISKLMESLHEKKFVADGQAVRSPIVDGPGGPAEGNSGAREGRGPRVVHNKRKSPDSSRGNGRGRGRARGRGGRSGQVPAEPGQAQASSGISVDEEDVDFEEGEDNAGESVP